MLQIFEPFIMLVVLISLGGVLYFRGLMELEFSRQLSRLVVRVTFPAMLFSSMYKNIEIVALQRGWVFSLIGLTTSILLAFTANYSGKKLGLTDKSFGTYQILCTNGNNIFLPVPIISALFGVQYLVYAFLFELGAGLFYWGYGVSHFRSGPRFNPKRLFNVNMLALLSGMSAGLLGLKLPPFLFNALDIVGNITVGSAMIIIGSLTAHLVKTSLRWRREVWGVILHRLILSPVLGMLAFSLFDLPLDLKLILLLMLAMPPLVTTALVAVNYDADEELAILGVVVPTLIALVVIPLVLWFVG